MITIILILKICLLSWIIVEHPLPGVIMVIIDGLINEKENKLLTYILVQPTKCLKCSSFYVGIIVVLLLHQPWWIPIVCSLLMDQYDRHLNTMSI